MTSTEDVSGLRCDTPKPAVKMVAWQSTSSFIRTMTFGSGISPDLLTLPMQALVGFNHRWGIEPRPEDVRQIQTDYILRQPAAAQGGLVILPAGNDSRFAGDMDALDVHACRSSTSCP